MVSKLVSFPNNVSIKMSRVYELSSESILPLISGQFGVEFRRQLYATDDPAAGEASWPRWKTPEDLLDRYTIV